MATYYPPANFKSYTLATNMLVGDLTLVVSEALTGLQDQGYLIIDRANATYREIVKYTGYDAGTKTFTVTRGQDGTSASAHTAGVTVVIGTNAAYLTDLTTYVTDSFAAPPAIGATTPAAASFTTLSVSGAATFTAALSLSKTLTIDTTDTKALVAICDSDASTAISVQLDATTARTSLTGVKIDLPTASAATTSLYDLYVGGTAVTQAVTSWYHLYVNNLASANVTNRYIIFDNFPSGGGSTTFFLGTGYGSAGFLNGTTNHDTESDEIRVNINGTTKYIKLFT